MTGRSSRLEFIRYTSNALVYDSSEMQTPRYYAQMYGMDWMLCIKSSIMSYEIKINDAIHCYVCHAILPPFPDINRRNRIYKDNIRDKKVKPSFHLVTPGNPRLYICMGISINSSCVAFTKENEKQKTQRKTMTSPSRTSSSTSTRKKTVIFHPAGRYASNTLGHRQ